jgi:DNA-binding transcriptional ArsR family regulator
LKRGLTEICYGFFSAIANPTRLAILEELKKGSMNVSALADSLGQEQSMVSHNLKPLERCALIYVERQGKEKIYSVNNDTVDALLSLVEKHAAKYCPFNGNCSESK